MRGRLAILLAIWATGACVAESSATAPSPSTTAVATPSPTPDLPPIATRVAWPPMPESALQTQIAVRPGIATLAGTPPLVAASARELAGWAATSSCSSSRPGPSSRACRAFRDGAYHGSEAYIFQNTFAPTAFAEQVRTMLQTPHPGETRSFVGRSATVERGSPGMNGLMLIEATLVFDDEVSTGTSVYTEGHTWKIRAFRQGGQFHILDGADGGTATLAPLAPFALDRELAAQIAQHLGRKS